jgi:hypothetical protein
LLEIRNKPYTLTLGTINKTKQLNAKIIKK